MKIINNRNLLVKVVTYPIAGYGLYCVVKYIIKLIRKKGA